MKREKQYDMFDVATGACTLDDYLFQRYSENDLSSTFWVDEKDEVDELRAPKPGPDGQPGTEPEVIPIQGPRAPKAPGPVKPPPLPEGLEPDAPPGPAKTDFPLAQAPERPVSDGQDTLQRTATGALGGNDSFTSTVAPTPPPESPTPAPADEAPKPPSMEDLLARFHQATKDYQERAQQPEVIEEEAEPQEPES